ncbi:hypothetical protein [Ancylobacter terrae]|uniref:hypothetical protein n=1 Tax=Ancylobacter sp. sgz301288 TaxID=3342077 RepID=UPI00385ED956
MSSPDRTPSRRRFIGLAAAGLLAASTAGCFQPMYAESTPGGGPGLRERMADIEIVFIEGRIANEVRNDLIFQLTGGDGNPTGVPYKLLLRVSDNTASAIIDPVSGLPEVELVTVDASWQLFNAEDLPAVPRGQRVMPVDGKKPITQGTAFGKASLDSGFQRFARARAIRDAQNRAATVVADQIRGQLASYLLTRAPKS